MHLGVTMIYEAGRYECDLEPEEIPQLGETLRLAGRACRAKLLLTNDDPTEFVVHKVVRELVDIGEGPVLEEYELHLRPQTFSKSDHQAMRVAVAAKRLLMMLHGHDRSPDEWQNIQERAAELKKAL